MEWFYTLNPILQAFVAGLFTYFITALGASLVFIFHTINRKFFDAMLGFGAGVMIAASIWSLLIPAMEISEDLGVEAWYPAVLGVALGALFLRAFDYWLPHLHLGNKKSEAEGIKTSWKRTTLLILAVTLHNIPEGLAIGVAFGAAASGLGGMTIAAAIALAIGIGLQNFPEGMAISFPVRRDGASRWKSFTYGQLSGIVEPIAAVIGVIAVVKVKAILPYALSFAAGAMLFVVIEQLIPESQKGENTDLVTLATIFGFIVMMFLDISLG